MSNWIAVKNDIWNLAQALGTIYIVIPVGLAILILFYKWFARTFICPMLFFFGSKSPRKLYWKIIGWIKKFILEPLFLIFSLACVPVAFILYYGVWIIYAGALLFIYALFIKVYPIYTILGTLIFLYFKYLLPKYKARFASNKINQQGV